MKKAYGGGLILFSMRDTIFTMEKQTNIFDVLGYPDEWNASDAAEHACTRVYGADYELRGGQDGNQAGNQNRNQEAAAGVIPVLPGQLAWCRSLRH